MTHTKSGLMYFLKMQIIFYWQKTAEVLLSLQVGKRLFLKRFLQNYNE